MRDARLAQVPPLRPLVAASLVEIRRRCGKSSCRCAEGEGHPAFLLTYKQQAKSRSLYVSKDRVEEVRAWVAEHRRVRSLLREVSTLTMALLAAEARVLRENGPPPVNS